MFFNSNNKFCILWQFLPLIFYCNFMGSCFYPPFWRPKGCKRHSAEQNQLSQPLLTNFRWTKICLQRTSATLVVSVNKFPLTRLHELCLRSSFTCRQLTLDSRGSAKFGRASMARQKTFPLLSAPLCSRCL